jgi:hypothetical protein
MESMNELTKSKKKLEKKKYQKPAKLSESLMTFGALCNGTTNGSRKQTTGAPDFCNASKLLS